MSNNYRINLRNVKSDILNLTEKETCPYEVDINIPASDLNYLEIKRFVMCMNNHKFYLSIDKNTGIGNIGLSKEFTDKADYSLLDEYKYDLENDYFTPFYLYGYYFNKENERLYLLYNMEFENLDSNNHDILLLELEELKEYLNILNEPSKFIVEKLLDMDKLSKYINIDLENIVLNKFYKVEKIKHLEEYIVNWKGSLNVCNITKKIVFLNDGLIYFFRNKINNEMFIYHEDADDTFVFNKIKSNEYYGTDLWVNPIGYIVDNQNIVHLIMEADVYELEKSEYDILLLPIEVVYNNYKNALDDISLIILEGLMNN